MNFTVLLGLVFILIVSCQTKAPMPNTLTDAETKEGWKLLFDGTTTNGWRGYNKQTFPDKGWEVKDGVLTVKYSGTGEAGYGGDIITTEQYENFEFSLDFKVSTGGNSGILFGVIEMDTMTIWQNAHEYQLLDDSAYLAEKQVTEKQLTGACYDMYPCTQNAAKPANQWQTAKIVVNKGKVEHWLNGVKVVEYQILSPDWEEKLKASKFVGYPQFGRATKGYIGIQDHGHTMDYRNIKIRPL